MFDKIIHLFHLKDPGSSGIPSKSHKIQMQIESGHIFLISKIHEEYDTLKALTPEICQEMLRNMDKRIFRSSIDALESRIAEDSGVKCICVELDTRKDTKKSKGSMIGVDFYNYFKIEDICKIYPGRGFFDSYLRASHQEDVRLDEVAYQRAILAFVAEIDKGFDNPFYMTEKELRKKEENDLMDQFFEDSSSK
jgi:hypothetical protein